MASIFTKIIKGEIPCYKIIENEYCIAFLDILPLSKGHTLIVPKKEVDVYFDLEDELFIEINLMAKKVARALKKTFPCDRIGVSVIGLEVPHAHIHLIPIHTINDMDFNKKRIKYTPLEFLEIVNSIQSNF